MKKILLALITLVSLTQAQEIYATFNVEAYKSANLAFTASGLVKSTYAKIGDHVQKEKILASLDNDDIKALLERAKTNYKYAKKAYKRELKIKNLIDEGKFDIVAKTYENAKNTLLYQQAMYNKTFLKAPFDGVIFYKDIETGDAVSGLMLKTVYKIQSKSKRKLLVTFDEKYATVVKVGDIFTYSVDGDSKVYNGKINKIYPLANSKNRKVTAEVQANGFMVGLFGTGTIHTK